MRISGYLSISIVLLLTAKAASAETYSGVNCHASGVDAPSMEYSQFGVRNLSTVARKVHCSGVTNRGLFAMGVTVYDRNPVENVDCTVFVVAEDGTTRHSQRMVTSGFGSVAMHIGTFLTGFDGTVVLTCSIPALNPTNGASWITTYYIDDVDTQ